MRLQMRHIQDHPSGRKSFRRLYPPHLRPYLSGTQLRVSLGRPKSEKPEDDPEFVERWTAAARQYNAEIERAERKHSGRYDALTPQLVDYLSATLKAQQLEIDDEVRWVARSTERKRQARTNLRADTAEVLEEALELRALGDIEQIERIWGEAADSHAASLGFILDRTSPSFDGYVRAYHEAQIEVWQGILQRLDGKDLPTPEMPLEPAQDAGRDCRPKAPILELFDAYALAQGISAGVRKEWRRYVSNLVDFIGHEDAQRLTRGDVVRWRDHLVETPTRLGKIRKPVTVRDKYITAVRCTLAWAVEERKLASNVAADVTVRVKKEVKVRDKDFTMDEAKRVLAATLVTPSARLSEHHSFARRWIPWLCAYSGARVNELSQLRKEDVREVDGIWTLRITPEAGTVKTREAREVPLHSHMVEQGFLKAVSTKSDGTLFYDPSLQRVQADGNRHFKKVGERLASWVRDEVGITDPAIKPNHAWRHLFKTLAAEAGIQERIADAIQGHAASGVSRSYGKVTLRAKADALAAFPRFEIPAQLPFSG